MRVLVVGAKGLQDEWTSHGIADESSVTFHETLIVTPNHFDGCVDLSFDDDADTNARIASLQKLQVPLVIVSSMFGSLDSLPAGFARICGWPTLLQRPVAEVVGRMEDQGRITEILQVFNRRPVFCNDLPGFITPRIISMIINEAFLGLDEQLSSVADIDTAMKLGTNYPYGPFEWASIIGKHKISVLLQHLQKENIRYKPAPGLLL